MMLHLTKLFLTLYIHSDNKEVQKRNMDFPDGIPVHKYIFENRFEILFGVFDYHVLIIHNVHF